jgi:hypothetical protein
MPEPLDENLIHSLKRVASVLKQEQVPFALAGGFAVYAHGGTSSDHDVDFLIKEEDAARALEVLAAAGLRPERPPEDWLVKVYDEDRLVDLIFRPVQRPVTDRTLAHAIERPLGGIHLPVVSATDLMVHKLLTFSQHSCNFGGGLPMARSLREQIDWAIVAKETAESPYAVSFLVLLALIDVIPRDVVPSNVLEVLR